MPIKLDLISHDIMTAKTSPVGVKLLCKDLLLFQKLVAWLLATTVTMLYQALFCQSFYIKLCHVVIEGKSKGGLKDNDIQYIITQLIHKPDHNVPFSPKEQIEN